MRAVAPALERFTPTAGTREALSLARTLAAGSRAAPRLLLLHGPPGVGKTHLLRAVLREGRRRIPDSRLLYAPATDIVDEVIQAFREEQPAFPRLGWKNAAIIALDDLHILVSKERTQREIARLLGRAVEGGSRVLTAASCSLSDLRPLIEGLRSIPGFVQSALRPATDMDVRRILAGMRRAAAPRPSRRDLRDIVASAGGDVRRAIGGLNGHAFVHSLAPDPPVRTRRAV